MKLRYRLFVIAVMISGVFVSGSSLLAQFIRPAVLDRAILPVTTSSRDFDVIITGLLGFISLLLIVSARLFTSKFDGMHRDAIERLDRLNATMATVNDKLDEHLRDHAAGVFHKHPS